MTSDEARELLGKRLICPGQQWTRQGSLYVLESGLLTADGAPTHFTITLHVVRDRRAGYAKFRFSLEKLQRWDIEPVYQLHIEKTKKKSRNLHSAPHEHFGSQRVEGAVKWLNWTATDALKHFCSRINLGFDPPVSLPDWD
jgi:hypothetical protein